MQNMRYDLDPQGDTILVLRRPNTNQPLWEPKDEVSKLKQKNRTRRRKLFGSDFMSDTEDEHSHDEQAPEPISPSIDPDVPIEREMKSDSAEKDLDTDRQETPQENSDRHEVEFRLSSRHLALASPVFKAMLSGFWKESAPSSDQDNGLAKPWSPLQSGSSCQVRYELTATEWVVKDFLLLMNIVHGHSRQVPCIVDLARLARISVLVDYYQCQEVTHFVVGVWIDKLYGTVKLPRLPRLPTQYGRDVGHATRAILSLKSEKWSTYPSDNLGASSHSCTLEKLLRPDIERLLAGLKGLKLDDYNGQKKKSADMPASTSRD
ncbi:hypothetical protein E4U30_004463 [Claviceps sp. LM220 group G6]|nr:hypothetical protein E4U30_004463 [Claviceps sp. LM220 group G6]